MFVDESKIKRYPEDIDHLANRIGRENTINNTYQSSINKTEENLPYDNSISGSD